MNLVVSLAIFVILYQASVFEVAGRELSWGKADTDHPQTQDALLTRHDEYILSKLYLTPERQRDNPQNYRDYAIQYYYSMNPDDQADMMDFTPRGYATIYKDDVIKDLKCHEIIKKTTRRFNNYVILPNFPDKDVVKKLGLFAKGCKQQYSKFDKLIVSYKGKKQVGKHNNDDMVLTKLPTWTNPVLPGISHQTQDRDLLTRRDEYILSKLYFTPKRQMRNNKKDQDYAIQYYFSMNPDPQENMIGFTPRGYATIYKDDVIKDLKCHEIIETTQGKFNNYVILPNFPNTPLLTQLVFLAKECKRQYENFNKLIVSYVQDLSKEYATLTHSDMVITKLPTCTNPVPTGISIQLRQLKNLAAIFQRKLPPGTQYGVFYFGKTWNPEPGDDFKWKQGFYENGDLRAALTRRQQHTEERVLPNDCNDLIKNADVYLFTYNSPCIKCAKKIIEFAKKCHGFYGSFTIYYYQPWKDCLQSSDYIISEKTNYKMYNIYYFQLDIHSGITE